MSSPLFGLIPAGLPPITDATSTPSPTSFLYALPTQKAFHHLVVFLLPQVSLPAGTAASIYLASAEDVAASAQPNFKFLGAIGPGKESAMFKVGNTGNTSALVVGVSIEPEAEVGQKMQEAAANKSGGAGEAGPASGAKPSTAVLAQRIIQNAFNFLAGFSGTAGPGGVEVVPLKAFEDWWKKFESRVRNDPSFLERQAD
ncbi:hypothetical protein K4F52_006639 [Lecanicillium sp. MT-2017a]|nr:hypothetical protein K4F52_006639 [Lecanicillium sp. MT-2017a]